MAAPRKPPPRATSRPSTPAPRPALPGWLPFALLLVFVMWVQRQTLGVYFALDDLVMFQQAHGVREWPLTAWRWLSGWAWFKLVVPFWGTEPFPYHATSLLVHTLNVLLLLRLARTWGASLPAAVLAGGLFGLSRLHFPALFAATSIGELLALTFVLLALLGASANRGSARPSWPALLAMALAVSAKESVMLVPFAALLIERTRARSASATDVARVRDWPRSPLAVAGLGLGLGVLLLLAGMGSGRLGGQAYAVTFGANLLENTARLAGWSLDLVNPIPDLHAATEGIARWVLPVTALMLTALAWRAGALARAGAAWWWLSVLPVLPLPGRTYLHYLYVPLAGLALAVAAGFDAWAAREGVQRPRRGARVVTAVLLLLYGLWSDVLLSMRMDLRMTITDWPLDPVLRKSEIARRSITDVSRRLAGRHADVVIMIPAAASRAFDVGSGRMAADSVVKRYVLREVLDGGRSLRGMLPNVDSVAVVHDFEPGRRGWEYFLSQRDSHVLPLGPLPEAHARYVQAMLSVGLVDAARDYARQALAADPADPDMRRLWEALEGGGPR